MTDLLQPYASEREADRRAREWLDALDHQAAVGSRHHIVPRFLLERFASKEGRLRVRQRADGATSLRGIGDVGVRDFYTVVTHDSQLDSSLESLLSVVEGGAAEVLRKHIDFRAFARSRAFTPEERATMDAFVAMQSVRGMRIRRAIEVITDYSVKLLNQGQLSETEMRDYDFVPHPNDHLRMFGDLADHAETVLKPRPLCLIHLDQPLLITGDEPVVITHEENGPKQKNPAWSVKGMDDQVQFEAARRGFADADGILLAVSPSVAMLYGPPCTRWLPFESQLAAQEAASFAAEHNDLVVSAAIDWVAANPHHDAFASMNMPEPHPVLTVHDNGSAAAGKVNRTAARRPIRRLRADDVPIRLI